MAYVARLADVSEPVVMGEDIREGAPIRITNSGARNDLPKAIKAVAGETHNVYVVVAAVDDFARPTDEGLYTSDWKTTQSITTGYGDPIDTGKTFYRTGLSTLWNPVLKSGMRAVAKRGVTFAVPSGLYVMSADIKVPGARIKVGSTQLWEVTASDSDAVGSVDRYEATNDVLILKLEQ